MKLSQIAVALVLATVATGCAAQATAPAPRLFAQGEKAVVSVSGQGVVTSDPQGIECGRSATETRERCTAEWVSFDQTLFTATPAPGWRFAGWRTRNAPTAYAREADQGAFVYEAVFEPSVETTASAR